MDLAHVPEWLKIVFIGWGVVSAIAAPIVGRFLAGSLHENIAKAPSDTPAYDSRGQLAPLTNESIAAPHHRI